MKIVNKNKQTKTLIIIVVVVAALALGYISYAYIFHSWPFLVAKQPVTTVDKIDYTPPTNQQKDNGNVIKDASIKNETKPAPQGTVDVSITATNQNENNLQIRTLIQALTSTGTCTLTMTKGAATVIKNVNVQALSSTSTCQGC